MKLVLYLFMTLPFCVFAQDDNNEYYYRYKLYKLSKNKENIGNKDVIDYVGINKVDTIDYELTTNNENATFFAKEKLTNEQTDGLNFTEIIIQTNGSWYYDFKKSLFYNTIVFNNKSFDIKYEGNYLDWKLLQDVENVKGYNCNIAILTKNEQLKNGTNREYKTTVWFSKEINSNVMPFGFVGLPGGIVKINFNDFTEAILDNVKQVKSLRKKTYKLSNVVTSVEFEKIQQNQFIKEQEIRKRGVDKD